MKKWHIILLSSVLVVAVLGVCGVLIYRYYITPKFISPIVDEIADVIKKEEVIDGLYEEAVELHEEGVIEDSTYANFVRAYNEFKRDDLQYAQEVLDAYENEMSLDAKDDSKSTKYASYKVGVKTIQVNDVNAKGKADVKYSDARASNRIKAEDVVEAERIIEEAETKEEDPMKDKISSAYEKLRVHMTTDEFLEFTNIMKKLEIDKLKAYVSNKEGLKAYLHEKLTDDEYKSIVNMGYKYIHLFIEK